jgi:TetR/AcrR family transcriptional regulator, transcriptional repressor for nem operon
MPFASEPNVKKGSFYYFFKSKSDLAAAALDADWKKLQRQLDTIFSPTVAPLERVERYFEFSYGRLAEMQKECGAVLDGHSTRWATKYDSGRGA